MTCTVTGTLTLPNGVPLPGRRLTIRRAEDAVYAAGNALRVPDAVTVTSGPAGEVSVPLDPGAYHGEVQTPRGLVRFAFTVPDAPTAALEDCL